MKLHVRLVDKLLPVLQSIIDVGLARNKLLCAELLWRVHRDQKVRKAWFESADSHTVANLKRFIQLDLSNTRRMKQIIGRYGWPGQSMVGARGCEAAWLLIQHADHDAHFKNSASFCWEERSKTRMRQRRYWPI